LNAVTNQLLVNLSFLLAKPTGTTNYALNLLPNLQKIEPTLLTSRSLPAAFAQLSSREGYELWLGGSGDSRYTPQLRAQVAELGLEGKVKFLDYIPQTALPQAIRQAIALVFPSLWEGFGLPVLEAMACGTPVITSNLSALVEVAGDAAIFVDPYQVQQIASAMHELSDDRNLRCQLRQAGIQRASQFDWAKTARSTIGVIEQYL
jgi:glycosyltransferase involved in cell wall biosynthesis